MDSLTFCQDILISYHKPCIWTPSRSHYHARLRARVTTLYQGTSQSLGSFCYGTDKNGSIIAHLPRKISSTCAMFLQRGGRIDYEVLAAKCYSSDLPQGGLYVSSEKHI